MSKRPKTELSTAQSHHRREIGKAGTRKSPKQPISLSKRLITRWQVQRNQSSVLQLCRQSQHIYLRPVAPTGCRGKPDHYFHFIFDLLLPLHKIILRAPGTTTFAVGGLGPFGKQLELLFPHRVEVLPKNLEMDAVSAPMAKHRLIGMNPRGCLVFRRELLALRRHVRMALDCQPMAQSPPTLLIERLPPQQYYVERGQFTSGAGRRSIVNHAELHHRLVTAFGPNCEVANLQLENLSLREQIEHFSNADVVIAQHGAALANTIWMQSHARVIELSSDPAEDHFSILCRIMGITHQYFACDSDHAHVDIDDFEKWLQTAGFTGVL